MFTMGSSSRRRGRPKKTDPTDNRKGTPEMEADELALLVPTKPPNKNKGPKRVPSASPSPVRGGKKRYAKPNSTAVRSSDEGDDETDVDDDGSEGYESDVEEIPPPRPSPYSNLENDCAKGGVYDITRPGAIFFSYKSMVKTPWAKQYNIKSAAPASSFKKKHKPSRDWFNEAREQQGCERGTWKMGMADGDPDDIVNWVRYDPPILPQLLSSNFHDSYGVNGFPVYVFPSATAIVALLNAPIPVRQRHSFYPGTFGTDGNVYADIKIFGRAAFSPDREIYAVMAGKEKSTQVTFWGDERRTYGHYNIKFITPNSTSGEEPIKALLARSWVPSLSTRPETYGQYETDYVSKPQTPTKQNPAPASSDNSASSWDRRVRQTKKEMAHTPTKDPTTISRDEMKTLALRRATGNIVILNAANVRLLRLATEDVDDIIAVAADVAGMLEVLMEDLQAKQGNDDIIQRLKAIRDTLDKPQSGSNKRILAEADTFNEESKKWLTDLEDNFAGTQFGRSLRGNNITPRVRRNFEFIRGTYDLDALVTESKVFKLEEDVTETSK